MKIKRIDFTQPAPAQLTSLFASVIMIIQNAKNHSNLKRELVELLKDIPFTYGFEYAGEGVLKMDAYTIITSY